MLASSYPGSLYVLVDPLIIYELVLLALITSGSKEKAEVISLHLSKEHYTSFCLLWKLGGGGTHSLPVHETLLFAKSDLGDIKQH